MKFLRSRIEFGGSAMGWPKRMLARWARDRLSPELSRLLLVRGLPVDLPTRLIASAGCCWPLASMGSICSPATCCWSCCCCCCCCCSCCCRCCCSSAESSTAIIFISFSGVLEPTTGSWSWPEASRSQSSRSFCFDRLIRCSTTSMSCL